MALRLPGLQSKALEPGQRALSLRHDPGPVDDLAPALRFLGLELRHIAWAAATGNGRAVNYVDWSNFFGCEDGTPAFPFSTLHNAVPCTLGAATISVRGGDYPEGALLLNKQMRIISNNGSVHLH